MSVEINYNILRRCIGDNSELEEQSQQFSI